MTTAAAASTTTAAPSPLEQQLGIYVTPQISFLELAAVADPVVAAGDDVVLTIAFFPIAQDDLPTALPDGCIAHFVETPPTTFTMGQPVNASGFNASADVNLEFGIDVDLKTGNRRVRVGGMTTWSVGTVVIDGCALNRGPEPVQFGRITIGADELEPGVWQVIPGAHRWPGIMPPPSSLRSPAQFAYGMDDVAFAEQWLDGLPTTTTRALDASDPLADEFATFTEPLPRSSVDRPDDRPGVPHVKVLYVVPTWATDQHRDTSGEIAQGIFADEEWLAAQNGGFGLELDTYQGHLDIGYASLDVPEEEWESWFTDWLIPAVDALRAIGWPVDPELDSATSDLYFVVWEAHAGAYLKTGAGAGTCRPAADATNRGVPLSGIAAAMKDRTPCHSSLGRFPFDGTPEQQRTWFASGVHTFVDSAMQVQRRLPGCGEPVAPNAGEPYVVPGGDGSVEIRGGFIRDLLEPYDPVALRMQDAIGDTVPVLDVRHDTYFHITSGRLATIDCNSDASRGWLWSDLPLDDEGERTTLRSSYDRPDDVAGRQVHFVYAVRNGTPDRSFDTDVQVTDAIAQMQEWLAQEADGTQWRIDTFNGEPDVTYFPLPPSVGDPTGKDCAVVRCPNEDEILAAYVAAGRSQPDKVYVVLYDGGMDDGGKPGPCGSSSGSAAFIHLDDAINANACAIPWSSTSVHGWSIGLLTTHELLHALGAVCPTGASAADGGHSSDRDDIMFGQADDTTGNLLDPGRDDYWGVAAGCTDLSADTIFVRGD